MTTPPVPFGSLIINLKHPKHGGDPVSPILVRNVALSQALGQDPDGIYLRYPEMKGSKTVEIFTRLPLKELLTAKRHQSVYRHPATSAGQH